MRNLHLRFAMELGFGIWLQYFSLHSESIEEEYKNGANEGVDVDGHSN